ncbi:hypothetical protein NHJ13051_002332 [Beauveria bassiana]
MWSYIGTVSQNNTTGNPFVSEQYLQYVTEVVPSVSCPRPVLSSDWMQQCSLGTEPDNYQLGAAAAFAKCIELANEEILCFSLANPDFIVGFCEIEVVGADTQKRHWYHVKFPGDILRQQQALRSETIFDLHRRVVPSDNSSHLSSNNQRQQALAAEERLEFPLEDGSTTMFWQLELWDHLARDISKQSTRPGLQSGNTVIDERNFALGRGW